MVRGRQPKKSINYRFMVLSTPTSPNQTPCVRMSLLDSSSWWAKVRGRQRWCHPNDCWFPSQPQRSWQPTAHAQGSQAYPTDYILKMVSAAITVYGPPQQSMSSKSRMETLGKQYGCAKVGQLQIGMLTFSPRSTNWNSA